MTQTASNAMIGFKISENFLATNQKIFKKLSLVFLLLFIKFIKARTVAASKKNTQKTHKKNRRTGFS